MQDFRNFALHNCVLNFDAEQDKEVTSNPYGPNPQILRKIGFSKTLNPKPQALNTQFTLNPNP